VEQQHGKHALNTCEQTDIEVLGKSIKIPRSKRVIPNRVVYQPMELNSADASGAPAKRDLAVLADQFRGQPGINWLQATAVMPSGISTRNQWVLTEKNLPAFKQIAKLHRELNPKGLLLIQLTHSGWLALDDPVTPYLSGDCPNARLLTDAEMREIQKRNIEAYQLAEAAGFHGAELAKECHGYLFSKMLNRENKSRPGWSYGGPSLEERLGYYAETMRLAQKALSHPETFVNVMRISMLHGMSDEFGTLPGSADEDPSLQDAYTLVRVALELGTQIINVSSGIGAQSLHLMVPTSEHPERVLDHFRWTAAVKEWVGNNAIVVGSAYSYLRDGNNKVSDGLLHEKSLWHLAAENIRHGQTDMIGLARQVLADPLVAAKLLGGDLAHISWCTGCGKCIGLLGNQLLAGCEIYDPFAQGVAASARRMGKLKK